jgi:hypothetical protein
LGIEIRQKSSDLQEVIQRFSDFKVGLRVFALNNDLVLFSVNFDAGNKDAISSELTHLFPKILLAFLVKLFQSELQDFLFLQNLDMQVNQTIDALYSPFYLL